MIGILTFVLILLGSGAGLATIRHVPVDYPTIQSALDALIAHDTVLVDVGLYEEALLAPSLDFVLRGNVVSDSGVHPRPIIDPSSLPDPTHRSCLRQVSGNTIIEDLHFRNRWPMHPAASDTGGGVYHPYGEITLRRCIFDSTYHSLAAYHADVTIEHCRFLHIAGYGPITYQRLIATDCDLQSDTVRFAQMMGRNSSRIERCTFVGDYGTQTTLHLTGNDIQVRDCVFGPGNARGWFRIAWYCTNSIFENNVIEDWSVGQGVFALSMLVAGTDIIRINTMRNCGTPIWYPPGMSLDGYYLGLEPTCDTCLVEFDNNIIENCAGFAGAPGVMAAAGHNYAHHNRFTRIAPTAVRSLGSTLMLTDNLFYDNDVALLGNAGTDARWNWWGDSTGPYCPQNPDGQGDSIGGNILFSPWYTDTTFFPNSIPREDEAPLPGEYSLVVYPNPFNPTVTLSFMVSRPGIVQLEVFNLHGQRVRELVNRRYDPGHYQVVFDAPGLPSGIYFAQIRAGEFVKTEKMVLLK